MEFQYHFPGWLLKRILVFSVVISKPKGPELLLRVFRVVSSDSELIVNIRANDLNAIRGVLESRKATIYDVDEKMGCTPLMVSPLLSKLKFGTLLLYYHSYCDLDIQNIIWKICSQIISNVCWSLFAFGYQLQAFNNKIHSD